MTENPQNHSSSNTEQAGISRRSFLRTGSVAGAGLVLGAPSILSASAKNAPSDELRVGFIGCGKQQEVLFNSMKNIPGIHYAAVCDIMKERVGGAFGRIRSAFDYTPNHYSDAEDMLAKEKDLDAVFVATPDFWHAPHTVMCLEAGINVYCEKMMSNTIEGARSMVYAAEASGKLCQIGHQRRSNPRYRYTLDQLIHGNQICGDIININGQWNRGIGASQDIKVKASIIPDQEILTKYGFKNPHQFLNWRWYRDLSGGPISDLGAHQIDIFNWYLGRTPKSVMASGGNNHFKNREHFDNVMCVFEYDTPWGGTRAFYQVLTTTSAGGGFYEAFMGTEGTVQISEINANTKIYRESDGPSWNSLVSKGYLKRSSAPAAAPSDDGGAVAAYASAAPEAYELPGTLNKPPHQPHIENFFNAIRGQEKLTCDARHAFESEAPIYWVNPAADNHETIMLTEEHLSV
ncbi:MAG: Gfo/Idh/MocA family oxidoreductase [Planctomycetota bacterium]